MPRDPHLCFRDAYDSIDLLYDHVYKAASRGLNAWTGLDRLIGESFLVARVSAFQV